MRIANEIHNVIWILVNRCGKTREDVSKMFGRNKNWSTDFMNRRDHKQITITENMVQCLNRLGYDIRLVKVGRPEKPKRKEEQDEKTRVEETAAAG